MIIYELLEFQWDDVRKQYVKTLEIGHEYDGPVEMLCGASSGQKEVGQQQSNFYNQLSSQATTVFGDSSSVYQSLVSTFQPTVAAGPNQQGFSPAELSNLNSEAITQTGQAYKNAKAAVGDAMASQGGGNTALPGGAQVGVDTSLASSAANQTASELSGITEQNYAVGRQNYENAVTGLANAPNAFNASTSADNAATGAGEAASNTENQISQQNNSWMSAVSGALGSVGGAALGGWMKGLGSNSAGAQTPGGGGDGLPAAYNDGTGQSED